MRYHYLVTASRYPLNEGPAALNLANTVPSARPGRDLLSNREQLRDWLAAQTGHLPVDLLADHQEVDLDELRALRTLLRRLLGSGADGQDLHGDDVQALNDQAARACGQRRLEAGQDGGWHAVTRLQGATITDRIVAAIADTAVNLLGSPPALERLRRCANPGCQLLFLARRPHRTWCDSRTCGNRMRVARHHARN